MDVSAAIKSKKIISETKLNVPKEILQKPKQQQSNSVLTNYISQKSKPVDEVKTEAPQAVSELRSIIEFSKKAKKTAVLKRLNEYIQNEYESSTDSDSD